MARATFVQLTDDLDGSEAVEELTFGLRGTEYELDLSAKNVAALEKTLDKFITAGRRIPKSRGSKRSVAPRSTNVSEIREWATANGFNVSTRGRISTEVREAYEAAV